MIHQEVKAISRRKDQVRCIMRLTKAAMSETTVRLVGHRRTSADTGLESKVMMMKLTKTHLSRKDKKIVIILT